MLRRAPPLLLAAALVAPLCFARVAETDAGFHLAVGRLIAHGDWPRTNALSFAFAATPWTPTSWLYDVVAFALTDRFGVAALQGLTFLLVAAALALTGLACARAAPGGAWLAPVLAILLLPRATARPHVASWVALSAVLALSLAARGKPWRWRAASVPIVLLAANVHTGAAFAAALAALFCAEAFLDTRDWRELVVAAAALLATLASPAGAAQLSSLLFHYSVGAVVQIQEFQPTPFPREAGFFAALAVAVVLAARARRERPAELAAILVFGVLGLRAWRMAYELEIVAAPTLARGLVELKTRAGRRAAALAAAGLALVGAAGHRLDRELASLRFGAAFDERVLPVRAAAFVEAEALDGPHFNALRDGGYLEWALPRVPAFIDARLEAYPPELWRRLEGVEHARPAFFALLADYHADWAIASRVAEALNGYGLFHDPARWALVHWDEASEVYLRRAAPRFAEQIARLEYRLFRPYGKILGAVEAARPDELPAYAAEVARYRATTRDDPRAAVVLCALARRRAAPDADAACAEAARLATDVPARLLAERASALR